MFITSRGREIIYRARTHVDPFCGLVSKLKNAFYAGGHFLVFPLLILDVERWAVSGGALIGGLGDEPRKIWTPWMPPQ